jgi:hypothetical protein
MLMKVGDARFKPSAICSIVPVARSPDGAHPDRVLVRSRQGGFAVLACETYEDAVRLTEELNRSIADAIAGKLED